MGATSAFKKTVTVVYMDTDRYGRIIGKVFFTDGTNLSHEIVKAGYAWWYRQYAFDDKELKALEEAARASQRGLWANLNPIPPWNFGRGAGSTSTYKSEQPRTPPDIIVYVTKTGKKYHRDGYRYLRKSRIPIKLEEAQSTVHRACSVCGTAI